MIGIGLALPPRTALDARGEKALSWGADDHGTDLSEHGGIWRASVWSRTGKRIWRWPSESNQFFFRREQALGLASLQAVLLYRLRFPFSDPAGIDPEHLRWVREKDPLWIS